MSSVSAQGVVERASAELSRRITGLGLRGRKRSPGVVERVASALCGPAAAAPRVPRRRRPQPRPLLWPQFVLDERFLEKFFLYFNSSERRNLAQVCTKWRDVLYSSPRWWSGLVVALDCRELRTESGCCMQRFYNSVVRRGIRGVVLLSATDDDINEFIRLFPVSAHHVHAIGLKGCTLTDRGLETILDHLQVLFELELTGCNEITEAGLWACLTPRIVSLTLADCINIADEAVGAVAQLLPSLYEFSLQAYHVTDAALGYFSPKQSASLSILRLHSCWELTNHGVVNIVHSLPNLTVLSLSGCSKVTDEGVELLAENLPRLRSLDLSWCPRVTDNALEYIACDLNHLEELTLDRCVHITDIGVGYISTMQSLVALFLRWCSQVRDFGVQHLCGMRALQLLSLAGCPLLTSSGLSSLIQLRQLRELELTNCPGVSPELLDYLHEHLPRCLIIESARASYGDDAVSYVQLKREGNLCTIKAKICPEHKVHAKLYGVSLVVDEQEETVISVECHDCVASQGGCKHAMAFLMWVHRRSEDPSCTSIECYWMKSKLSRVGSTLKYITAKELSQGRPSVPSNTEVFEKFLEEGKKRKLTECEIMKYQNEYVFDGLQINGQFSDEI